MSSVRSAGRLALVLLGRAAAVVPAVAVAAIGATVYFASAVPASAQNVEGLCDRTEEVRDAIVAVTGTPNCAHVARRHLMEMTDLNLSGEGITTLRPSDLVGLHALRTLDLSANALETLPVGVFDELHSLRVLRLHDNRLDSLPPDIFDELLLLEELTLHGNRLTVPPDGMFDDLSRFKGVHRSENVQGLPRLSRFLDQHDVTTVEAFIEALPDLHKERVVLVYESGGLGAEHVSPTHPRVVSWGANGEYVFAWQTNPDAADEFKHAVEFLIPGATAWTAGIVDFAGEQPAISTPAVCQSCHGSMNKPLFTAFDWPGTEYFRAGSDTELKIAAMKYHIDSANPRIAPLDLDFPDYYSRLEQRLLPASEGAFDYEFAAEEASKTLALRHAEVLLGRLKARDDYAQFAEDAVCAANRVGAAQAPFTAARDHTLAVLAGSDVVLGGAAANRPAPVGDYNFRSGTLSGALLFLLLHDLWETHPEVRGVFRTTLNTDAADLDRFYYFGATAEQVLLHEPGQATAEDELLQLYRLNFGYGNRAMLAAVDSHNNTWLQGGSFIAHFDASLVSNMAPKVCETLRNAKMAPQDVRAATQDGQVRLRWSSPQDATSITGYRVLRSSAPRSPGSQVATTGTAVTAYSDSTVVPGNTYFYWIAAHRGDKSTESMRVETHVPQLPTAPEVTTSRSLWVREGETAVVTLAATGGDTGAGDLSWSIPAGSAGGADRSHFTLASGGGGGRLALVAGKDFEDPDDDDGDATYEVTVQVSDGTRSATADLKVSLSNVNEAPTADVGENQAGVEPGSEVTLSGAGSDPDAGDVLTLSWAQVSGPEVVLSGADTARASFDAPSGLSTEATLVFALTVTDSEGVSHRDEVSVTVAAAEQEDLTAWADGLPASHGGGPFSFVLHFSENIAISYRTVRDSVFEVTGGTILKARRYAPSSNVRWIITVDPSSDADVVLVLPSDGACDTTGSVCTSDGRALSNRLELTIEGAAPASEVVQQEDLTAWADGLPASHGGDPFSFVLHFSENIAISYRTVRDSVFEVTGGTILKARRFAPPSNVRWIITVEPSSDADVVLVLPSGGACDTTGPVCTSDGRALRNRLEITIPWSA